MTHSSHMNILVTDSEVASQIPADYLLQKLETVLTEMDQLLLQTEEIHLGFKPTAAQMSLCEIGCHVYQIVLLMTNAIQQGRYAEYDLELIPFSIQRIKKPEEIVEYGKYVRAYLRDLRTHISETDLQRAIPPRKHFTGLDALWFMMQESIHHCGQLTVYLRLLGITPAKL